ncbi:MAG: hypothetical protein ACYYNF_08685 [Actinomycetes bacterium]
MCHQTTCKRCEKATWAGCGQHVEQALAGVPRNERCACSAQERSEFNRANSVFGRLFRR